MFLQFLLVTHGRLRRKDQIIFSPLLASTFGFARCFEAVFFIFPSSDTDASIFPKTGLKNICKKQILNGLGVNFGNGFPKLNLAELISEICFRN